MTDVFEEALRLMAAGEKAALSTMQLPELKVLGLESNPASEESKEEVKRTFGEDVVSF